MLSRIIYSHSDFSDILNIQTSYLDKNRNNILLIDENSKDLELIYKEYNKIIYYDPNLSYPNRILALQEIENPYILFYHDIDILVQCDNTIIDKLYDICKNKNLDRIDLQYTNILSDQKIGIEHFFLTKEENPDLYIYNVNPSIWKTSVFLDVMENFKHLDYRSIESIAVQKYCTKFNIYKLWSNEYIQSGYFKCLDFFQFIHITHGGGLLPIENNNLSDKLNLEYQKIQKTHLGNDNRSYKRSLW